MNERRIRFVRGPISRPLSVLNCSTPSLFLFFLLHLLYTHGLVYCVYVIDFGIFARILFCYCCLLRSLLGQERVRERARFSMFFFVSRYVLYTIFQSNLISMSVLCVVLLNVALCHALSFLVRFPPAIRSNEIQSTESKVK